MAYRLYVREFPKEWETAEMVEVKEARAVTDHAAVIEDRLPTSTYQLRVVAVFADGTTSEPSEEATIDTAVGNCAPKADAPSKKCCVM